MSGKTIPATVYDHEWSEILTTRMALEVRTIPGISQINPAECLKLQETVKGKHIMSTVKRMLTAAALSTALAGGVLGLGSTTAANASASSVGISASASSVGFSEWRGRCLFAGPAGAIRRGHYVNKAHLNFKHWRGWRVHRERGCVRTRHFVW
ncbi:hypothetical protein [Nonomuraea endophytica]|uniref:Uncharacterized protein n=2 Tax=Nonomuraea TaxID=83681 RepID=A0A7W8EJU7_9ACTN|nr:hypothetical protein [Nonomuraea endophytica]MBB5081027.1 hypothetical protein [Nonomuraea endophytica]